MDIREVAKSLSRSDLVELLTLSYACQGCGSEETFHRTILAFSDHLGFEYVLYAHTQVHYNDEASVHLVNLSNPAEWMDEYATIGCLAHDPVRIEFERQLAQKNKAGIIVWDAYDRPLSKPERKLIAQRRDHRLHYGLSAFCDSPRHDSAFVLSLASRTQHEDERARSLALLAVPHLMRCRKRLDLRKRLQRLTEREQAVCPWLINGKTNWEIARILNMSESTAKFHVANILRKLGANSRQDAVSTLIAERFLT